MDPEAPRPPGDLEESEPEGRPAGRPNLVKKPLDVFLVEFEQRLREHPGEAATSAGAALQGRADGSWRTPVEGGERGGRRLQRRAPWPRPEAETRAAEPVPHAQEEVEPATPSPPVSEAAADVDPGVQTAADPAPGPAPEVVEAPGHEAAVPAAASAETATPSKRRNRHRRRHHR
ncbi:MAG TPA: hypothetical protein VGR61_01515 [Candidatus Dormibacteraeota bacterium]|nr:hypothetical protein [Candidatus Dormibacteraeota bacterium]